MRRIFILICCLFVGMMSAFAQSFSHPGIEMNKDDLDYMREQVQKGREPWKKSFDLLENHISNKFEFTPYAHVISGPFAKPDIGGWDLMNSSEAAYSCALLWYATKDERYAKKSY